MIYAFDLVAVFLLNVNEAGRKARLVAFYGVSCLEKSGGIGAVGMELGEFLDYSGAVLGIGDAEPA